MSAKNPNVRYGLLIIAVLVIITGSVIAYLSTTVAVQGIGLTLLIIGVYLGKKARASDQTGLTIARAAASSRPGLALWALAVGLSVATAIAYYVLHEDALHGGHQAWPVDVFAGVGLLCGTVWAALIARLVQ